MRALNLYQKKKQGWNVKFLDQVIFDFFPQFWKIFPLKWQGQLLRDLWLSINVSNDGKKTWFDVKTMRQKFYKIYICHGQDSRSIDLKGKV